MFESYGFCSALWYKLKLQDLEPHFGCFFVRLGPAEMHFKNALFYYKNDAFRQQIRPLNMPLQFKYFFR